MFILCPNRERVLTSTTADFQAGFILPSSAPFVRRCGLSYRTSMPGSVVANCSRRCPATVPCSLGVAAHLVAGYWAG